MSKTVKRTVFFISDGTGITAETLGQSLLTQFNFIEFKHVNMPFIDSEEKINKLISAIKKAHQEDGEPALVFSTQMIDKYRELIKQSGAIVFDFFETFITQMEGVLGVESSHKIGQTHGIHRGDGYHKRIDSINFALGNDDGISDKNYENADIILVGVSRSGKTPTCLFLAIQYGIYAANYPLIEEDLANNNLPTELLTHQHKVFGLTINPLRLRYIRAERRNQSNYASLAQCQREVRYAESLFQRNHIPFLDSSQISIEEIAASILDKMRLKRRY